MKLRCWAPIELAAVDLPDGSAEVEHKVLVYGEQKQRDRNGIMRTFEITPKIAEEMVANCERDAAVEYEAPAFIGHPDERDKAPAVGWVKALKAKADGLYAVVRYRAEMVKQIRDDAFRYVSPTFTFAYEDQHGVARGAKLLDIGVLNTPHQKNVGSIPLSDVAYQLSEVAPSEPDEPIAPNTGAGDSMSISKEELTSALTEALATVAKTTDDKIAAALSEFAEKLPKPEAPAALGDTTDKINSKLIELGQRIGKAEASIADKDAQIVKLSADVASAKTDADGYKFELTKGRIEKLVNDGFENGTLEAKDVPGFGTDAFDAVKWLSESKFNGERGLRTHVATASPVVAFSERRKSAPGSAPASDDVEIPEDRIIALGFKDKAEFEKFANMGAGDSRRAAR